MLSRPSHQDYVCFLTWTMGARGGYLVNFWSGVFNAVVAAAAVHAGCAGQIGVVEGLES